MLLCYILFDAAQNSDSDFFPSSYIEMNHADYVGVKLYKIKLKNQKRKLLTHAGKLTSRRLHTLTSFLKRKQANLLTDLHKLCTSLDQDFIRNPCIYLSIYLSNMLCFVWKFSCIRFHSLIHAYMNINDACNFIFTHQ